MSNLSHVDSFRILTPCDWWPNRKAYQSRNKLYCKGYAIELTMKDGTIHTSSMQWHSKGAGRDCYMVVDAKLCVKMYPELNFAHNMNECAAFKQWHPHLPEHVPLAISQHIQEVRNRFDSMVPSDVFLLEATGRTLKSMLLDLNHAGPMDESKEAIVRGYVMGLVEMSERVHRQGLVWYEDFHSGNVTFDPEKGSWVLIDLEGFELVPAGFTLAQGWNKAGKRLCKESETGDSGEYFKQCVQIHLRQKSSLSVEDIRAKLCRRAPAAPVGENEQASGRIVSQGSASRSDVPPWTAAQHHAGDMAGSASRCDELPATFVLDEDKKQAALHAE